MSLARDWPLTALVMALGVTGAWNGVELVVDCAGDPEAERELRAVLPLPCGLPVRIANGEGVRVSVAELTREAVAA